LGVTAHLPLVVWIILTNIVVILAWVPFRAPDLSTSFTIYREMFGAGNWYAGQWIANPIVYGAPETLAISLLAKTGLSSYASAITLQ